MNTRFTSPHLPLPQLFLAVVERLPTFPINAPTVPEGRIPVLGIIRALMLHAPDPLAYAQDLADYLDGRRSGPAWQACWSNLEIRDDNMVKADEQTITNIALTIQSSPKVQYCLYEWSSNIFNCFLMPMWQASRSKPQGPSQTQRDPYFPKRLLARDGPACLLTGTIDLKARKQYADVWSQTFASEDDIPAQDTLEGAHIIPLSLHKRSSARVYLLQFSGNNISLNDLTNESLNRADNGLMLERSAHAAFGGYRISINCEDVLGDNGTTYSLTFVDDHAPLPKSLHGCNDRTLPFGAWQKVYPNPKVPSQPHPLPNNTYLRLHLALARVLNTSGAREVIDQIFREQDELGVEADFSEEGIFLDPDQIMHTPGDAAEKTSSYFDLP